MSDSTVTSTYHLFNVLSLQIIIDKQKETEMSKEKITSLTLQVTEQEERSGQLETMESK